MVPPGRARLDGRAHGQRRGALTATYSYDVYGAVSSTTGSPTATFTFDGEQTDASGLIYLRARYDDPGTGRFVTQDPSVTVATDTGSLNRYAYGEGNPVMVTDPFGLCSTWPPSKWGDCPQKAVEKTTTAVTDYASNVDWLAVGLDTGIIGCSGAAVVGAASADPLLAVGGLACQWLLSASSGAKTVVDAGNCKSSPLDFSLGVTNTIAGLNPGTAGIASGVSLLSDLFVAPYESPGSTGYLNWCHPQAAPVQDQKESR